MSHHVQLQVFHLLNNNQAHLYGRSFPAHIDSPQHHHRQKSEPISDESATPRLGPVKARLRESLKSHKSGLHPGWASHVMSWLCGTDVNL